MPIKIVPSTLDLGTIELSDLTSPLVTTSIYIVNDDTSLPLQTYFFVMAVFPPFNNPWQMGLEHFPQSFPVLPGASTTLTFSWVPTAPQAPKVPLLGSVKIYQPYTIKVLLQNVGNPQAAVLELPPPATESVNGLITGTIQNFPKSQVGGKRFPG